MVIRSNNSANNTNRMLKINNDSLSKSTEKLSTGYKINKAADDAAGLAISEKMRLQIRGLNQGSLNSEDGISLLQTADGGLNEIHSILQRCNELAVKSANGTYTDDDRSAIQKELDQSVNEVDRLAYETEFNGYPLLSGTNNEIGSSGSSDSLKDVVNYITTTGGITDKYTYSGTDYSSGIIDFSNINSASDVAGLVGKGVSYTCCTCDKNYSIKFVSGTPDTSRLNDTNPVMEVDVSSITNGNDLVSKIIETAYGQSGYVYDPTTGTLPSTATSFVNHYSQLATDGAGKLYIYDNRASEAGLSWPSGGSGEFNLYVYGEADNSEKTNKFFYSDIQVGGNSGEKVRVKVQSVTANDLGISGLKVDTQENAESAITKIDNAISIVSESRSIVGAYQNRLEYASASTANTSENLQSAESKIRDTDMAKEIMNHASYNVLVNASQSILSQTAKDSNSILDLLK